LRREFAQEIIGSLEGVGKPKLKFDAADQIAKRIRHMFEHGEFDVCTVIYNKFKSAMTQIVTAQQLIPFAIAGAANENAAAGDASYEYEPEEDAILEELLPRNIGIRSCACWNAAEGFRIGDGQRDPQCGDMSTPDHHTQRSRQA
jgi:F-type H+-transporting ATPase subunit gamma